MSAAPVARTMDHPRPLKGAVYGGRIARPPALGAGIIGRDAVGSGHRGAFDSRLVDLGAELVVEVMN